MCTGNIVEKTNKQQMGFHHQNHSVCQQATLVQVCTKLLLNTAVNVLNNNKHLLHFFNQQKHFQTKNSQDRVAKQIHVFHVPSVHQFLID